MLQLMWWILVTSPLQFLQSGCEQGLTDPLLMSSTRPNVAAVTSSLHHQAWSFFGFCVRVCVWLLFGWMNFHQMTDENNTERMSAFVFRATARLVSRQMKARISLLFDASKKWGEIKEPTEEHHDGSGHIQDIRLSSCNSADSSSLWLNPV